MSKHIRALKDFQESMIRYRNTGKSRNQSAWNARIDALTRAIDALKFIAFAQRVIITASVIYVAMTAYRYWSAS